MQKLVEVLVGGGDIQHNLLVGRLCEAGYRTVRARRIGDRQA